MSVNLSETAEIVLGEMLEQFAFVFGDPMDKDLITVPQAETIGASLEFAGYRTGRADLLLTAALGREIAANVMGLEMDATVDRVRAEDSVKELLNILCGQLLSRVAGEQPVFNLAVPTVGPAATETWRDLLGRPDTACIEVDGSPVLYHMRIEGPLP